MDYGDKTNYRTYEDVVISVFADGDNKLEICRGDEVIEEITILGRGNISRRFERGYYTVKHINTGKSVDFCVTMPQITHTVHDGKITVKVDSCDTESKILYMDFREKTRRELEKKSGIDDFYTRHVQKFCCFLTSPLYTL